MKKQVSALKSNIFLVIVLLVGLVTSMSYGAYLDFDAEQGILLANIKEYCIRIFPKADLIQEMTNQGIIEISQNIERDHGIALYYPAFLVWYKIPLSVDLWSCFWNAYTFLLIFAGICALYKLTYSMFRNRKIAMLITSLFFLTPRIFAESHYNNKDVVLLSMTLCIFYYGYRLLMNTSVQGVIAFACVGAFATNIKIIGAWIFGIVGIYVVIYYIFTRQFNKQLLCKILSCIGVYACVFILITPAAWNNVIDFFAYLIGYAVNFSRWNGYILFDGNLIHHDYTGMPKKYLVIMVLLTVPVVVLMLILAGGIILLYNIIKHHTSDMWLKEGYVLTVLLAGGVPFAYAVLQATPLYNGWRHFYFTYASMIIVAGYACNFLSQRIKNEKVKFWFQRIAIGYVLFLAGGIIINHPQEHSYYNILAGKNIEYQYELDYWGLSTKQALEIINDDRKGKPAAMAVLNLPTFWGIELNYDIQTNEEKDSLQLITDLEKWKNADYVVVNTTYAYIYSKEQYSLLKNTYKLLGRICSYGNTICEVYKRGA